MTIYKEGTEWYWINDLYSIKIEGPYTSKFEALKAKNKYIKQIHKNISNLLKLYGSE